MKRFSTMLTMTPTTMLALTLLIAVGCDSPKLMDDMDVELTPEEKAAVEAKVQAEAQPEPAAPPRELDENGVATDATVFNADSPQKGRKSKEAGGYLGAVAHSRFWAEHEMIRIQLVNQMNVYNAINDRYPQDQDEYMKEIVKPLGISLPELPAGEEYVYDPSDHQLKVQATE